MDKFVGTNRAQCQGDAELFRCWIRRLFGEWNNQYADVGTCCCHSRKPHRIFYRQWNLRVWLAFNISPLILQWWRRFRPTEAPKTRPFSKKWQRAFTPTTTTALKPSRPSRKPKRKSDLYRCAVVSVRPSVRRSVPCYFRRWKVRILGASCAVYPAWFMMQMISNKIDVWALIAFLLSWQKSYLHSGSINVKQLSNLSNHAYCLGPASNGKGLKTKKGLYRVYLLTYLLYFIWNIHGETW